MGLNVQAMAIHRILDPEQRLIETYRVGPSGVISNALRRKGISIVMAWKSGEVRYDSDLEKRGPEGVEAFRDRFAGLPIRAHLDVPFSRGVISALSIHPDAFTETDVAILRQVAEIYSVGISRVEDLERIGEVEREAEQRRVLTETAGAAAHEINQPLTVVLGLTQLMLLNQALDPALRHDLETIHKAGQQIREIVGKMISLRQYVTKPYIKDVRIVDFDAGSRKD
jgi:signal transduction histidine kinase